MASTQTPPQPGGGHGDYEDRSDPARYTATGVMLREAQNYANIARRLAERNGSPPPAQRIERENTYTPAGITERTPTSGAVHHSAPRTTRATRTGRITTSRRTAAMAGSSSRSSDDGGGDPPDEPAPIGAPMPPTVGEFHRAEHDRTRDRIRVQTMLGVVPKWITGWGAPS